MKHPGLINTIFNNNSETFKWSEKNFSKVKKITSFNVVHRNKTLAMSSMRSKTNLTFSSRKKSESPKTSSST